MKTSRKLCVIGVFLLGSLVTIAGAIRLMYVIEAFNGLASYRNTDISCMQYKNTIYASLMHC